MTSSRVTVRVLGQCAQDAVVEATDAGQCCNAAVKVETASCELRDGGG